MTTLHSSSLHDRLLLLLTTLKTLFIFFRQDADNTVRWDALAVLINLSLHSTQILDTQL